MCKNDLKISGEKINHLKMKRGQVQVLYKVDEDKAFIITNHHVIENADSLEVILSTEEKLEAELLGSDLFMDLAVLQVNSEDIEEVVDIGTSENINVGEPVI